MDPFSAFGVAANVIAFVDFSWKLCSSAREIYRTGEGTTGDIHFLGIIVKDIQRYNRDLVASHSTDNVLDDIVAEARQLSAKLLEKTEQLTQKKSSRWKSFTIALQGVLKQRELNAWITQLERLQKRISDHVQLMTLNDVSDLAKKIKAMEKANAKLGIEWQSDLTSLYQSVLAAIQNVVTEESRQAVIEHVGNKIRTGKPVQASVVEDLSQDLQGLRRALQSFQDQGRVMESEQRVLESLYFDGIKARLHTIDQAHEKTFQWIFHHTESPNSLFDKWLKTDSSTFFIYGKPGSGKSTLMKFICHAPETKVGLKQWADGKKIVIAHFFFWNAGSTLQKSQEGLLRGLLYEILRRCRNLISLAKKTIGDVEDFESDQDRWNKEQLLETYQAVISNDLSTRFCFFIDGLDEYHDSNRRPEGLVQTLRSLQSSPNIKLCVSSRPWPAFTEAFADTEWVLKVEDLTRDDILRYVSDKFNTSGQYRLLTQKNSEYISLLSEVATNANGVFLWVVLVVRDLLEGFTNNDSVQVMRERLKSFPKDLELFFQHMLNSISPIYQRRMARTFQTAVLSQRPLLLIFYSFLHDVLDIADIGRLGPGDRLMKHISEFEDILMKFDDKLRDELLLFDVKPRNTLLQYDMNFGGGLSPFRNKCDAKFTR